jgi:hypothetical protein
MDASQAMFISQNHNLVACFNLIETYQSMGRIIPHIMENIETTNQQLIPVPHQLYNWMSGYPSFPQPLVLTTGYQPQLPSRKVSAE